MDDVKNQLVKQVAELKTQAVKDVADLKQEVTELKAQVEQLGAGLALRALLEHRHPLIRRKA